MESQQLALIVRPESKRTTHASPVHPGVHALAVVTHVRAEVLRQEGAEQLGHDDASLRDDVSLLLAPWQGDVLQGGAEGGWAGGWARGFAVHCFVGWPTPLNSFDATVTAAQCEREEQCGPCCWPYARATSCKLTGR